VVDASVEELANYDAIIVGVGTRFGRMASRLSWPPCCVRVEVKAHFGMVIVGLDYGYANQMTLDEITGGSPYGATTIAGTRGSRKPTENELKGVPYQGRKITKAARKLRG
jgi:NAD(P)H dehydrogenase (quinone)